MTRRVPEVAWILGGVTKEAGFGKAESDVTLPGCGASLRLLDPGTGVTSSGAGEGSGLRRDFRYLFSREAPQPYCFLLPATESKELGKSCCRSGASCRSGVLGAMHRR